MEWLLFVPVFKKLYEISHESHTYLILMNISVLMTVAITVAFYSTKRVGIAEMNFNRKYFIRSVTVSGVLLVLLFWTFMVSDLYFFIRDNQSNRILEIIINSEVGFILFYCILLPLVNGILLTVLIRTIEFRIMKKGNA